MSRRAQYLNDREANEPIVADLIEQTNCNRFASRADFDRMSHKISRDRNYSRFHECHVKETDNGTDNLDSEHARAIPSVVLFVLFRHIRTGFQHR